MAKAGLAKYSGKRKIIIVEDRIFALNLLHEHNPKLIKWYRMVIGALLVLPFGGLKLRNGGSRHLGGEILSRVPVFRHSHMTLHIIT